MMPDLPPGCPLTADPQLEALQAAGPANRLRPAKRPECFSCALSSDCTALADHRSLIHQAIRELGEEWKLAEIFGRLDKK